MGLKLLSLVFINLLFSCSKNPVTGKKQLAFMSERQEIALGAQADPEILAMFGLYQDSVLQAFIEEKGQKMAAISHRPHLKYHFRIVDSPILNAFAVPGGYVYFTRGIMAHFNNEAEFAGVLGHEIGHITARHSVIQQRNQILAQIGLMAGIIAVPELANFIEPASVGLGLLMLRNSRDAERQSDRLGVEYSSKIGYDARYMGGFFRTIERFSQEAGAQPIPTFLSTHPDPGDRLVTVTSLAKEWQSKNPDQNYKVARESYLKMIDGIVYGEDPRQGFVENNRFYHPELKFQFSIPNTWNHQNSPTQFQVAPKEGNALLALTLSNAPNVQAAVDTFLSKHRLTPTSRRNITINGLKAAQITADHIGQNDTLSLVNTFIAHGNYIYSLLGLSKAQEFNRFQNIFNDCTQSFSNLTDPDKLNRQPKRVRIVQVKKERALIDELRELKIDQSSMEEHAILNGMELGDILIPGDYIKIIR